MMEKSGSPVGMPKSPPAHKEEPEQAYEEDIPSDDGGESARADDVAREERPLRQVERE
ncbi:MAG: hypothetical protein V4684_03285 [Pseudomonadota bacterium]